VSGLLATLLLVLSAGLAVVTALYFQADRLRVRAGEQRLRADRLRVVSDANAETLARQLYINRVNLAYRECLADDVARADRLLDACDPARRGWEWDYCRARCHMESLNLGGFADHASAAKSPPHGMPFDAAYSPDGRQIVTFTNWGSAPRIWDAASGKPIVAAHIGGQSRGVAISPADGRVAVGTGERAISLWDPDGRRAVQYIRGHSARICDVAFSPDGRRLASASEDGTVRLWAAGTGREIACFRGHTSDVLSVGFSPDGRRLVSCSQDNTVKVWGVDASSEVLPLKSIGWGFRAAYGPDGHRLAFAFFGQVLIVDVARERVVHEIVMPKDSGGVRGLSFSPDGKRVATCSEFFGHVIVWDAESGTRLCDIAGHPGRLWTATFSPDGRVIASAGDDGAVRFWDAQTGRDGLVLGGHEGGAFGIAFDLLGRKVATIGWDGVVRLWDATNGAPLGEFRGTVQHKSSVYGQALAFDPDGRRLAATSDDGTVHIWDIDSSAAPMILRGHSKEVNSVVFGPGERRITTASQDQTIKVWDASTGEEVFTLRGHTGGVLGIAISPDGRRMASTGTDGTATLWIAPSPGIVPVR